MTAFVCVPILAMLLAGFGWIQVGSARTFPVESRMPYFEIPLPGMVGTSVSQDSARVGEYVESPPHGDAAGIASLCPPPGGDFAGWLDSLGERALELGVNQSTLDRALDGVTFSERVYQLSQHQPEFVQQIWAYLDNAISDWRIHQGRVLYERHRELLDRVSRQYGGVPGSYLVAIWGLESNFGNYQGSFSVVEALVTLGFSGRRQEFACRELLAVLRLLNSSQVVPWPLLGSWAGASGHGQFIPSTLLNKGVDFDQDGHVDIWNSLPDTFASMANLLSSSGWSDGVPWGMEIAIPAGFDYTLSGLFGWQTPDFWRELGILQARGQPLPVQLGDRNAVWLPAGHQGPAFLVTENFHAILAYNFSGSYALAIGALADQIARGKEATDLRMLPWPRQDIPLSRSERIELQQLLIELGYDVGEPDAIIGRRTRSAIQAYQSSTGRPAHGYASLELLESLRKAVRDRKTVEEPAADGADENLRP